MPDTERRINHDIAKFASVSAAFPIACVSVVIDVLDDVVLVLSAALFSPGFRVSFTMRCGSRAPCTRQQVEDTLRTNFFDTVAFTEKMLPLVRK